MGFSDSTIESAREYAAKAQAAGVVRVGGVSYFAVGSAVGIANVLDSLCDEVDRLAKIETAVAELLAMDDEEVTCQEQMDAMCDNRDAIWKELRESVRALEANDERRQEAERES